MECRITHMPHFLARLHLDNVSRKLYSGLLVEHQLSVSATYTLTLNLNLNLNRHSGAPYLKVAAAVALQLGQVGAQKLRARQTMEINRHRLKSSASQTGGSPAAAGKSGKGGGQTEGEG